jgi:hypothetical protein
MRGTFDLTGHRSSSSCTSIFFLFLFNFPRAEDASDFLKSPPPPCPCYYFQSTPKYDYDYDYQFLFFFLFNSWAKEEIVIILFLLFLRSFAYPVISIPSFSSFSPWRNPTRSGESAGTCPCLSKNTFVDHPIFLIFFLLKNRKKSPLKIWEIEIDLVLVTKKRCWTFWYAAVQSTFDCI